MKNSRQIASETLYKIFYDDAYSNIAIDSALSEIKDGKSFITRLVYGVVERKITIDSIISKYCDKPKPKVLILLRMGVYQLYFMDKVPSNAAINESVELANHNGLSYYSKLINAVLHKVDNNRIDLDAIEDMSIKYSVPQHLINMWYKAYGKDNVDAFLPCLNESAPVFAVPNTTLVDTDELLYELNCDGIEGEVYNDLVVITSSFDLKKCRAFQNGLFHIEDLSCYNAVKALGCQENDIVFDICSAPGGKAFTAASLMNNQGKIYAFDIYEHRVKLIKEGAERLGLSSITAEVNNGTEFNSDLPLADKIICDVPCSGFGIIRRKPEIRYKDLDSIKDLPALQYEILHTSSKYLKQGGRLLYSTCTLNKRENEKIVEKFISENSDFSVLKSVTTFPSENGGDGFFYSIIERN
ncbi:MAG: 16S rRNA (cytosine(967)-C(5))-methyltransferase RsmB [Eubacterium sp.]|nr:16S rRNA (cytosine(967)-C(5))-methyltransferase RsmB [Eubacterium sp.]